jgi:hypothetical protein
LELRCHDLVRNMRRRYDANIHCDIWCVEHGESNLKLVVRDMEVTLKTDDLGVSHIGSIKKGAEEKDG